MTQPKISVVTPSFNQGGYIEDAILSVLDQGYPNCEFFICDAGSTDQTLEVIRKYEKHLTWWCSAKDKGQTDAINKGLRRSTGQILCYMNSDDFFLPHAFESVAQAWAAHPEAGLFTGNGLLVDGAKGNPRPYMNQVGYSWETLLRGSCYLLQPSTFVTRRVWEKVGEFDDTLKFGMDLDYWLRAASQFPVVFIDEALSAWRIHENIKTTHGGFQRWTELWHIYRKHTQDQLTPGLLVELFNVLKSPLISQQLGLNVESFAESAFWKFYSEMQKQLGTKDCIPVGQGAIFKPVLPLELPVPFRAYPPVSGVRPSSGAATAANQAGLGSSNVLSDSKLAAPGGGRTPTPPATAAAPAIIRSRGSQPRVDIVLQATGNHAWAVGGGWENAARQLGALHRVFRPRAQWGEADVRQDDGLFKYLAHPEADLILLLGFDWHSQMLHAAPRWLERWRQCRAAKILYVQESIVHHGALAGDSLMERCCRRAAACADLVIYTDLNDRALMESLGKPALFQPFGVDDSLFQADTAFASRLARPFFRGKHQAFAGQPASYSERRTLIQHLLNQNALDLLPYLDRPLTPEELAADFNRYQIAANFPSVFSNHPTRVYEAMACGCALITNRTGQAEIDRQFEHGKHLLYYSNPAELGDAAKQLMSDSAAAAQLAAAGRQHVLQHYALHRHLDQILRWAGSASKPLPARAAAPAASAATATAAATRRPILIDGVIFQFQQKRPAGISRVWTSLLQELAKTDLAQDIILLDRDNTAPLIPGIQTRPAPSYNYQRFEGDSLYLQDLCDQEQAALFVSTYYTYPERTRSMLMLHDMIPEVTGQDLNQPEWRAKAKAIEKAHAYLCVSHSTLTDFRKLHPELADRAVYLTPNAVGSEFQPASQQEVNAFRARHEIRKPYFLLVGNRTLYKNAQLFFRAFASWDRRAGFEVVCVGGAENLEECFRPFVRGVQCRVLGLNNAELAAAYSGAAALVYPSRYEGFGLPVLEAQQCHCPVITCRNSSITEVAGDAALFVGESDVAALQQALTQVLHPEVRRALVAGGEKNCRRFSWSATAGNLAAALQTVRSQTAALDLRDGELLNTVERFIWGLNKANQQAAAAQLLLYAGMAVGCRPRNLQVMAQLEEGIAAALAGAHDCLADLTGPLQDCEALLCYGLGLAYEKAKQFHPALQAYQQTLNKLDLGGRFSGEFRVRLGLRLARLTLAMGEREICQQVLLGCVFPLVPDSPEGLELLAQARGEKPAPPSAGFQSAVSPISQSAAAPVAPSASKSAGSPLSAGKPLVSAIVSAYKSERFLRGCLEDLERQTIADQLEIVVVDTASPQNERAIVEEFQQRYSNIVYIRTEERETVYGAWNRGIQAARGQYITNANTDDRHRPDALEILARTLDQNPDISLAYADCLVTRTENETFETAHVTRRFQWLDFSPTDLLLKGCFVGPQPMWRREVHDEHGYFDAGMVSAGDYEFWLRLAQSRKFLHVKESLGLYLESPASVEHSNRDLGAKEVLEAQRRYSAALLLGSQPVPAAQASQPAVAPVAKPAGSEAALPQANPSGLPPSAKPITLPPCALVGHLGPARKLFAAKKLSAAWESALAAIQARPFHPEAYLLLAELAQAAGDAGSARRCAQHATQLAPGWQPAKAFLKRKLHGATQPNWLTLPEPLASEHATRNTEHDSRITHHASRPPAPRLSVCLIVKNEERFLDQCLASVRGLADQVVVVDTGSSDRTVEIAQQHQAEVYHFTWCDDFSAARNAALEHVTGDWVLVLDADEELPAESHAALRKLLDNPAAMAWRLPIIDVGREAEGCSYVPRLFRNAPALFYVGRVHEQVFSSIEVRRAEWGLDNCLGDAALRHHGYRPEILQDRNKIERNLRLLERAIVELPNEPNLLMNYGLELVRSGKPDEGLAQYWKAFEILSAQPPSMIVPELLEMLLTQLCTRLMALRQFPQIVRVLTSPLAQANGLSASLHFTLGLAHLELKQFRETAAQMRQCLTKRAQRSLAPINPEIHKAGPRHCLALSLAQLGEAAAAVEELRQAVEEDPQSRPARFDYAKLLAVQGRPVEALHLLLALATGKPDDLPVWLFGAQLALSRPESLEVALDWTAEALNHHPDHPALLRQRAEALTLAGQCETALPFWQKLQAQPGVPAAPLIAAMVLCEAVAGGNPSRPPAELEPQVSREFLKWYQRLLQHNQRTAIEALNSRLEALQTLLPLAASTLSAALEEALEPVAS